jgi:hypothetical protein
MLGQKRKEQWRAVGASETHADGPVGPQWRGGIDSDGSVRTRCAEMCARWAAMCALGVAQLAQLRN